VITVPKRYRRTERYGRSRSSKVIDFGHRLINSIAEMFVVRFLSISKRLNELLGLNVLAFKRRHPHKACRGRTRRAVHVGIKINDY